MAAAGARGRGARRGGMERAADSPVKPEAGVQVEGSRKPAGTWGCENDSSAAGLDLIPPAVPVPLAVAVAALETLSLSLTLSLAPARLCVDGPGRFTMITPRQ